MYCECPCNTLLRDSEHGAICLTTRGDEACGGLPEPQGKIPLNNEPAKTDEPVRRLGKPKWGNGWGLVDKMQALGRCRLVGRLKIRPVAVCGVLFLCRFLRTYPVGRRHLPQNVQFRGNVLCVRTEICCFGVCIIALILLPGGIRTACTIDKSNCHYNGK